MNQVVQARCPHCKNVLRIPTEWIAQAMRCKHCSQVFQVRPSAPAPQAVVAVVQPKPTKETPRPANRPIPIGAPVAPPPGLNGPAFAFNSHAPVAPSRPRRRGWWKPFLVCLSVAALATVFAVALGPQISDLFSQTPTPKAAPRTGERKVASADAAVLPPKTDTAKADAARTDAPKKDGAKVVPQPPSDSRPKSDKTPADKGQADKSTGDKTLIELPPPLEKDPPKKTDAAKPKADSGKPKADGSKPKIDAPKPKIDPPKTDPVKPKDEPKIVKKDPPKRVPRKPGEEVLPRRALFISVNDYLFANPLHYGASPHKMPNGRPFYGSNTWTARGLFSNLPMRFPATQIVHLSDGGPDPHAPVKPVIERTVLDFLNTSRPQDRIVLLFAGHVVEDDKEAYLVPIEGDLSDTKTLIPLTWVYDRLKECKAREKLLILDVCRFDPTSGMERPGGDPMGKVLDGKLQQPPPGVQVWSSCILGQQSLEFANGSVFLQSLCSVLQELLETKEKESPGMPLQTERLVELVNAQMTLSLIRYKLRQTSRLTGKELPGGAPPDADEPDPVVVSIEPPPIPGGAASLNEVAGILAELNQIPPVRARKGVRDERLEPGKLPAFPAKVLGEFKADYGPGQIAKEAEKSPFRQAIVSAVKALQESATRFSMRESFAGANTAQVKGQIKNEQSAPGKAKFYLKEAYDDLKAVAKLRAKEPSKRWQAQYDYVLARTLARLIFVVEYNYVLAQIRTDSLPELPEGVTTYKLALGSRPKISVPESYAKDWVKELKRTWDKIVADYPETPWAVVARRERLNALGLEWRAAKQ
jgi:hypothetical protein